MGGLGRFYLAKIAKVRAMKRAKVRAIKVAHAKKAARFARIAKASAVKTRILTKAATRHAIRAKIGR
jgi:predicted homoserine dehydrogenase-like protein